MIRIERVLAIALLCGVGCSKNSMPMAEEATKDQRPSMTTATTATSATTPTTATAPVQAPTTPMKTAEEMMIALKKSAAPVEEHMMLKPYAGMWKATAKMWMAPDTEPKVTKAITVNKMILGDRFLEQKYTCKEKNEKFEGQGLIGFDSTKKKFVSNWIDTMGTGLMIEQGMIDPATKMITMQGKMVDPMSGKEIPTRSTVSPVDKNTYTYAMYTMDPAGKEFKMMEIVYKKSVMTAPVTAAVTAPATTPATPVKN